MRKILKEFEEFALKGNMIDLAVGVVIGSAFSSVVNSIVNDILMPIVGVLIGGRDFSALMLKFGDAQIKYGLLIQNLVNFFIISFWLFIFIKALNSLRKRLEGKKEEKSEEPEQKPEEVVLLGEIKSLLENIGSCARAEEKEETEEEKPKEEAGV